MWGCCTKDEAASLERLQNFAAQPFFASAAGIQRPLPGESLASQPCLAQHSHKAIHGLHPPYLQSLFTLTSASHGHCTRQASTASVHPPLPRTNFGGKAFSYHGAAIWNSLPTNVCIASTISTFISTIHPYLPSILNDPSACPIITLIHHIFS